MNFKINKDFDIQIYDDIMNIPVAPLLKCKDRRPNVTGDMISVVLKRGQWGVSEWWECIRSFYLHC